MLDQAEITQRLAFHEGIELQPYRDTLGKLTIGIGRCIETNPFSSEELKVIGDWKNGITKNAAFFLLRNDIKKVEKECQTKIRFWEKLDSERQYALIDMTFQLGICGVLRFKKMLYHLGLGNYNQAAEECLDSKYAIQTPARAHRISETIKTGRFII